MNLACPDCGDRLRSDGRCDRCASTYDDMVARGPDPYAVAAGLDLRAAEDADHRRAVARRTRAHATAIADDRHGPWWNPEGEQ